MLTDPQPTGDVRRPADPIACQPWCEYADGHGAEAFRADQVCYSPEMRTTLGLHQSITCADGRVERDYVGVLASARPDTAPRVEVTYREWPSVTLSPDEARRLAASLHYAIALCESTRARSQPPDLGRGRCDRDRATGTRP